MANKKQSFIFSSVALAVLLFVTSANAINFTVGTDGYYVSVGDYDYLPYGYDAYGGVPRVNFHDMMSDYGNWVTVPTFGQAWRPYASQDWRPYTQGRWVYTSQYGPMWQGYEPWAWAGYHYGNWIFTQAYGWVWLPGYEWHPGRVSWAQGYDSVGWSPLPPAGYDYSRGQLGYVGSNNMYSYYDQDFGAGYGDFGYGGPYYDSRYQSSYYNPAYSRIGGQLWVFVESSNFWRDNYADYYLGPEYANDVFQRRLVRVTNQRLDRPMLERITRQRVVETPIEVRELQTEKQRVRVVVPKSEELREQVRRNSTRVVRDVIAPAFAERNKPFKGENAKNKDAVRKAFHQENAKPRVETLDSKQVVERAERGKQQQNQERDRRVRVAKEKIDRVEKEGKIRQPAPASKQGPKVQPSQQRPIPPQPENRNRPKEQEPREQPEQRQNPNVRPNPPVQPVPQNPNVRPQDRVLPQPPPDERERPVDPRNPLPPKERPVDPRQQPDLQKDNPGQVQPEDERRMEPQNKETEEMKQQREKQENDAKKKQNKKKKDKDKDKDNNNEDDDPPSN